MRTPFILLVLVALTIGTARSSNSHSGSSKLKLFSSFTQTLKSPGPTPRSRLVANQHEGHAVTAATVRLSLAIDGSSNRAAISSELAYGHFLSALASLNEKGRDAALGSVGLTLADRGAFVGALGPLSAELMAIADQRRRGASLESLQSRHRAALDAARIRVQAVLSPGGTAALDAYIESRVKKRIKVYRSVPAALELLK